MSYWCAGLCAPLWCRLIFFALVPLFLSVFQLFVSGHLWTDSMSSDLAPTQVGFSWCFAVREVL